MTSPETSAEPFARFKARLQQCEPSQEHLLQFWPQLSPQQQQSFAAEMEALDLAELTKLYRGHDDAPDWTALAQRAQSPPAIRLQGENPIRQDAARAAGEQLLRDGRVGMILVAGGQGTRLGFPHPKGMFPIGPVSGRTLFQVIIEQLLAVGRRFGRSIPLYLMTSSATHDETVTFLNQHARFGMREEDLIVFCQGSMPALDAATGRLLLDEPGKLSLSPDGHGGMLAAFAKGGALQHAKARGITQIFYGQVDNPLLQVCSPELLGYHTLAASEMTTQVVRKRHPLERVGNVVSIDGRVQIIEYSDLPESAAKQTNPDGTLRLWAGNLAVHVFAFAFLERAASAADSLPFHRARKKVPYVDPQGQRIDPAQPNGLKFERFIFDLLPQARNALVVEADPAEAFAPVKNADGEPTDSPTTAKAAMVALHRRWLGEAGITVGDGVAVELSPFVALDAEELRTKGLSRSAVTRATFFQ
ncbi:MAG: hypothetical protein RIS70_1154 [Planctomycetota bacterium]